MAMLPLGSGLRRGEQRALLGCVLVMLGLIACAGVRAVGGIGGPAVRDWLSSAVYAIVSLLVFWRAWRVRAERRWWLVLGMGLCAYALGNLIRAAGVEHAAGRPTASVYDGLRLALYPAGYIALVGIARHDGRRRTAGSWLDGIITGSGLAALSATLVFPAVLASASGPVIEVAIRLAYPVADLLLAALVIGVVLMRGGRMDWKWRPLGGGFIGLAIADSMYSVQVAHGAAAPTAVTNVLCLLGIGAIAVAAWQPIDSSPAPQRDSWAVMLIPGLFAFSALVLLASDRFDPLDPVAFAFSLLTLVAALTRATLTFRGVRTLARRLAVTNRELELRNSEARQANEAKTRFLANVSHELRTPLNAIIGFTELMYDGRVGPLSDEQREFHGDVLVNSHHLLDLINDILDIARVEAGKLDLHPKVVDVARLADEVVSMHRTAAAHRGITVELDLDPRVPVIWIDPTRLRQVLVNYVSNAVKFTPPGGRVRLRTRCHRQDGLRLEVHDTGLGIAEEDLGKLFSAFGQLGPRATEGGTGLGLAVTKSIVEAHGGSVGVRSSIGKGSVFTATFPRVVPSSIAPLPRAAPPGIGEPVGAPPV